MRDIHLRSPIVDLWAARIAIAFAMGCVAGCGGDPEPLETGIDPEANVVEESPVPFAPTEGGLGLGTYEDDLTYTFVVLTDGAIDNAGEEDCGQFAGDLEVELYGALKAGSWDVRDSDPEEGVAAIRFADLGWTGGTVTVDEGNEERGSTVRGRIDATSDDGQSLAMTFEVLSHGCGRD